MATKDVKYRDILGNPIVLKDIPILRCKDGVNSYKIDDLIEGELKTNAERVVKLQKENQRLRKKILNAIEELERRPWKADEVVKALKEAEKS